MEKKFYAYILANRRIEGALYIGVTSNLIKRVWEHKEKLVKGHTEKYNIDTLVYFEEHGTAESAITREKQLKKWKRDWKVELIESKNPVWVDLYPGLK